MRPLLLLFLTTLTAHGYEISTVKVSGSEAADVDFQSIDAPEGVPPLNVVENGVELTLPGAELHRSFRGKLDISSPHVLVGRITAHSEKGALRVRIVVNGSAENLKARLRLSREKDGLRLRVQHPGRESATLSLLKEEQEPLKLVPEEKKASGGAFSLRYFFLVAFLLAIAAGATAFLYVTLKKKGAIRGNRKFLIEQLAHCSLGHRSGVSLVRVGREFVLVGVTPQSITMLSSLPALQAQYEEESRFERETFHDAVDEEITRLKKEIAL